VNQPLIRAVPRVRGAARHGQQPAEEGAVTARFLSMGVAANPTANLGAHRNGPARGAGPARCGEGTNTPVCSGNSINLNEMSGVITLSANDAWACVGKGKPWAHTTSQGGTARVPWA
jgi:hypothetical protein